jgi:hypothetical protein
MNAYSSAGGGGQAVNDGSVTMTRCSAHASGNRGCGQCRGRGRGRGRGRVRVRVSVRVRIKRGFLPRMPNLYAIQQCARRRSPCEWLKLATTTKISNNNTALFPLPSTKQQEEGKKRGRKRRKEEERRKRRRRTNEKKENKREEEDEPLSSMPSSNIDHGARWPLAQTCDNNKDTAEVTLQNECFA